MFGNDIEHTVFEEKNDSSYTDLYKYSQRNLSFTQEKRRELFLQKQKEKRCEAFDEKRDLSELFTEESSELMECESVSKPKPSKKQSFSFKLMGSEWFTQIPEDFSENWLIKLCPEGVRFLVVANKGETICYFRNGKPSLRFKSELPGGNPHIHPHKFTILDCIYNKTVKTFFVYDVLAWNSMSLINAEAHMRFYWLKTKFEENPEIRNARKFNFLLTDCLPAQNDLLQDHFFTPFVIKESELPYEGVLFYHKEGHYVFGSSPLVGWLKMFMLPEVLHIDLHPIHLQTKPDDYESIEQYLKNKKHKKKSRKSHSETMDLEQIEDETESIECDNL